MQLRTPCKDEMAVRDYPTGNLGNFTPPACVRTDVRTTTLS
jgi:hypothetical protein